MATGRQTRKINTPPAADVKAKAEQITAWHALLRSEVVVLLRVFYIGNGALFFIMLIISFFDLLRSMYSTYSFSPVVTDRAILALIAASAAQLGVLAATAGRNLFRMMQSL
jgi:hypothetical protein